MTGEGWPFIVSSVFLMCIHIYLHKKDIVTTHVFVSQYIFLHKVMAMSAAFNASSVFELT